MSRPRLPWFKVQSKLAFNPKFRRLSSFLQGNLLKLWCCAADQSVRGSLPELRVIAEYLGQSYIINIHRIVPRVLKPLLDAGFVEYNNGKYAIHEWDYWQSVLAVSQPDTQPDTQPDIQPAVESFVVNNHVTGELDGPRELEELDNLFPVGNKVKKHKLHTKQHTENKYHKALLDYCSREWETWRGTRLSSVATNGDYVQFAAMLHRVENDPAVTLQVLQNSFTVFASSNRKFDRQNGLGYWSSHWHGYASGNGAGPKAGRAIGKRVQIAIDENNLEWWKGKKQAGGGGDARQGAAAQGEGNAVPSGGGVHVGSTLADGYRK